MQVRNYADAMSAATAFVHEWAGKGEVLVLAATRAAADDLVRSACITSIIGVHRFALRELAIAASSQLMNQLGLTPVRQIGREALATLVTSEALSNSELGYLKDVARFPGFPRALARTFEHLRLNRIKPETLRAIAPDLAALLARYEAELGNRMLADHARRVELAIEARFRSMPVIFFDVEPAGVMESDLLSTLKTSAPALLDIELGRADHPPGNALASLQRYVLSGETVPAIPSDDSFAIFSASGESLECAEIARRILAAVRDGFAFDHIAVLLPSAGRYEPLVAEALRRAGIPAFFTRGARAPDPAGRALLALLRCTEENYSATRFAEYLSLGQMPSEEHELRSTSAWERALVDAAVIGGKHRWQRRLDGLAQELLTRYNASEDTAEQAHCLRRIDALESLAAFALPLIEHLEALPRSANWSEWLEALERLARVSLKKPETVDELLEELSPMGDVGPVALADVVQVIEERLTTLRIEGDEDRYGKVFIGSIEEARAMSFRLVFLPGLNEGIFPRLVTEDPLLLDPQREAVGIITSRDDAQLLRIACACASERLVISWSRLDLLTGRPRVPSFYAFEAVKAARGAEVEVRAFEAEARAATDTRTGWPAPSNPSDAIDDLEFDLAYLRPAWNHRTKGEGGYLREVNPHVVRSLRARWMRWNKPWRWPDGFVELDVHVLGILEEHKPSKRAWSPSALQQYARCPYRFALKGILGLHPPEQAEAVQRISPVVRGIIYHQVQFELLRDLKASELPLTEEFALPRLRDVIARVADEYRERLAPAILQVWEAEIDSIHADLRGWVQHKSTLETDWTPKLFELSFGLPGPERHDPASVAEPVEALPGMLIRGSVDIVEQHSSGVVRVVDHKTGRVPKDRVEAVGGGEYLQPSLYALAVERARGGNVSGGRLFYSTLRQNYKAIDIPLNVATRHRITQVMAEIERALHVGFLPAAPRKDGCKGCEFLTICGPWEEERVTRKSKPELHQLTDIRRLP